MKTQKAGRWLACAATKGVVNMKQTAASTVPTNHRMVQQDLPFSENFVPGWSGKRYLLCSDGAWHLVLEIRDGMVVDTQCCADATLVYPVPEGDDRRVHLPMCKECVALHFPPAK